jgi:hypothetical protein
MAYLTHKHSGQLPASAEVLTLTDLAIASTAVKVEDSEIICRVYAATEKAVLVDARMHGLQSVGLRSLSGERITHLEPFQIGQLALEPRR